MDHQGLHDQRLGQDLQDSGATCPCSAHTGCPISQTSLCFCLFLGFWSTYRGTSDLYSTALEIGYMIGTRILKIDLKIAEIIDVKVGTCHLEIDILLLHRVQKIILVLQVPNLTSVI